MSICTAPLAARFLPPVRTAPAQPAGAATLAPAATMSWTPKTADTVGRALIWIMNRPMPSTTPVISDAQKAEIKAILQPGDIILETNNRWPGWEIAEKLTLDSDFTHSAMYVGDGKVIDSGSKETVDEFPVDEVIHTTNVAVVRPPYSTPQDREAAIRYCRDAKGREYDNGFDTSDDKTLYCSELIYQALAHMPNAIIAPTPSAMGRPIVPPDIFGKMPGFTTVWTTGSSFGKGLLSHWPLAAFAVGGAVAGGMIGGGSGALLGGALGFAGSWEIGCLLNPDLREGKGKGKKL